MPKMFEVDDLYLHQKVTEVACRPGVSAAAFTVRSIDREKDDYVSCIWLAELDGSQPPRQLTQGPGLDQTPRWSPQGDQLAFLSSRTGVIRPHLLALDGGEARALGEFDNAVSDLRWAPDGQWLALTAAVPVDPDWRGARAAGRKVPERGSKAAEVGWKLPYKSDGVGYTLSREIHLFRLDANTGEKRQLSDGPFEVIGFDIAPDGQHIAQVRTRVGRFAHATDLWVTDQDGGNARRLTQDLAMVMQPLWSPDGRWIVFTGACDDGDARLGLWLLEFASGKLRRLGDDDLEAATPEAIHWSADSQHVFFARAWRGRHPIVRMAVADGAITELRGGDRQLGAFAGNGERFAYGVEAMTEPSELHTCLGDGGQEQRLSDLNAWWRERAPLICESREFEVPDGRGGRETIQGWLLRAKGRQGPLPLLNDVHGGPAAYVQLDYDTNVFWQVLCAQGWAVLALDAVGSASYGREFCDRVMGHWGEYDLPQHLAAVAQLQREGVCDDRVAICGKSYGGYLSSYAVGHSHDFRAAVVMAPVGNIETHYGTSDGGYYADPYYMGSPGGPFDRKLARQLSPLQSIERAKTPTLFMQGKDDERCPKCQSEELFVSLARAGDTPAELVLYPEEDHHFLGEGAPSVRADAAQRIVDWVTHHASQRAAPDGPQEQDETEESSESTAG